VIARYTSPEMGRIWSDRRRFETWLEVETVAAEVMAEAGLVPRDAARDIREKGNFDVARIDEIEKTTQHDLIAFTTNVAEYVGPSARWLRLSPLCRRWLAKSRLRRWRARSGMPIHRCVATWRGSARRCRPSSPTASSSLMCSI
jgi:hypothetical protein